MTCHNCKAEAQKFGFFLGADNERIQRYRCKQCRKTFGDIPQRPLESMRVPMDKAVQIVHMLCEGVGVRAAARLANVDKQTVLALLELAGAKCTRLLDVKIRNLQATEIQVDEMHCFVWARQKRAAEHTNDVGDQYIFLALTENKLIAAHCIGKRDNYHAHEIMRQLNDRVASSFQLTTDGFAPYRHAVPGEFDEHTVHFAQLQKTYATRVYFTNGKPNVVRALPYAASRCTGAKKIPLMGNPDPEKISTSHIERQNLSMRLFNRRLGRLTMNWSKKLANLKHSVALQVAFLNFCRVHRTLGETPAQASGLTDHKWSVEELLKSTH